jgi:hypothetical protein
LRDNAGLDDSTVLRLRPAELEEIAAEALDDADYLALASFYNCDMLVT